MLFPAAARRPATGAAVWMGPIRYPEWLPVRVDLLSGLQLMCVPPRHVADRTAAGPCRDCRQSKKCWIPLPATTC